MGHNSVVSNHPKSTGISRVDWLSTGPPNLGCHMDCVEVWSFIADARYVLPLMSRGNSSIEEEDGVKGKLLLSSH